jgi:hypothetical protein
LFLADPGKAVPKATMGDAGVKDKRAPIRLTICSTRTMHQTECGRKNYGFA